MLRRKLCIIQHIAFIMLHRMLIRLTLLLCTVVVIIIQGTAIIADMVIIMMVDVDNVRLIFQ
jgi:hypothetical protein